MNSNLVPTPIVDKNGVPSTRLKKVDQGKSGITSMPAPAAPSESAVKAQRKALTNAIVATVNDMFGARRNDINKMRSGLEECSLDFLQGMAPFLEQRSRQSFGVGLQILMATPELQIRENMHYADRVSVEDGFTRTSELVEAMRSYEQFADCADLTAVDEKAQERMVALMLVTDAYSKYGKSNGCPQDVSDPLNTVRSARNIRVEILDDALAQFVMDRSADVERIVEIINDRGLTEPEDIKAILDWDTPSLSEGVI